MRQPIAWRSSLGIPFDDILHERVPESDLLPDEIHLVAALEPPAGIGVEQSFNVTCDLIITNVGDDNIGGIAERVREPQLDDVPDLRLRQFLPTRIQFPSFHESSFRAVRLSAGVAGAQRAEGTGKRSLSGTLEREVSHPAYVEAAGGLKPANRCSRDDE